MLSHSVKKLFLTGEKLYTDRVVSLAGPVRKATRVWIRTQIGASLEGELTDSES